MSVSEKVRKPKWLKVKLPTATAYKNVRSVVKKHKLHTICESGNCPNTGECWGAGTATFMILGNICTRSCGFCNVQTGRPLSVDINEPKNIANSVKIMKVKHAVITSVDRDDLKDGGSNIWAETVNEIRKINPNTTLETLIPDFKAKKEDIQKIIDVAPEVVSHNMETVERLTKKVRIQAKYRRSLDVLKFSVDSGLRTKTGMMVGLGETYNEVLVTMKQVADLGVKVFTIGQYLQPTKNHLPVGRYVDDQEFYDYEKLGLEFGFEIVKSGSLVRSSYRAEECV